MNLLVHRRVRAMVDAYVDGELEVRDARVVRAHLRDCWWCSADAQTHRLVRASLRRRGTLVVLPVVPRARSGSDARRIGFRQRTATAVLVPDLEDLMTANISTRATPTGAATRIGPAILRGALFGMAGSLVMAAFAMMAAATYQHVGFFTPLYHIASTFVSPSTLMASMQEAMAGHTYYLVAGPAVLGAVVHMMTGAMYGLVFAVVATLARLRGAALVAGGVLWGAMVFLVSSFVVLPVAARLFGSGDQIAHMAATVGYGTFLAEHLLYGLALGLLLASRRLLARR